jgi:hypothetical protein
MIHIVSINGQAISVSIMATVSELTTSEDKTLRKLISEEVGVTGKKFWMAQSGVLYLEDGVSLHLASLVKSCLDADEELADMVGRPFNFAIGFDTSIYLLKVMVAAEGIIIEDEGLHKKEAGLDFIRGNLQNSVYFACGESTKEIANTGCRKSDVDLDISQKNSKFFFKRAWETTRIMAVSGFGSMLVMALYFSANLVLGLLPEATVVVPDTSPRITPNLAPIVRNIADQQQGYVPLLSHGLSTLGTKVQGVNVVMAATGTVELNKITYRRLQEISSALAGDLLLGDSAWTIDGMESVYSGVSVAPTKLVALSGKMESVMQLNSPRRSLALGGIVDRTSLTGSYSEYRGEIEITRPTKRFLYDFARQLEETGIAAEYLGHSYTVKNGQLATLNLSFLLRGY